MIPVGRLLDVSVYSLLIFVPFLFLGIYPFRRHLRFSFPTTNALVVVICILQIAMGIASTFWGVTAKPLYLIRTCIYAVFYFIMVDFRRTCTGALSMEPLPVRFLSAAAHFGSIVFLHHHAIFPCSAHITFCMALPMDRTYGLLRDLVLSSLPGFQKQPGCSTECA